VRPDADVALALNTRLPDHERGRAGFGVALAILIAVGALLALDLWAFLGWRGAVLADAREARTRRRRALRARRAAVAAAAQAAEVAEAEVGLRVVA
jgi:hypothetical protein